MTTFTQLTSASFHPPEPFADQLRLAVAAYLARFKGTSREHTESDLRCYLAWCAEQGLDPLMASAGADQLLPSHGPPVIGAGRVREALTCTAAYLESLVEQTLALMNAGARLDEIIHAVRPPADLAAKPYLQPVYDEPEFIVRNVWRLYGGWYDGNPAHLKPAPDAVLAAALAGLAGGAAALADRAQAAAADRRPAAGRRPRRTGRARRAGRRGGAPGPRGGQRGQGRRRTVADGAGRVPLGSPRVPACQPLI